MGMLGCWATASACHQQVQAPPCLHLCATCSVGHIVRPRAQPENATRHHRGPRSAAHLFCRLLEVCQHRVHEGVQQGDQQAPLVALPPKLGGLGEHAAAGGVELRGPLGRRWPAGRHGQRVSGRDIEYRVGMRQRRQGEWQRLGGRARRRRSACGAGAGFSRLYAPCYSLQLLQGGHCVLWGRRRSITAGCRRCVLLHRCY